MGVGRWEMGGKRKGMTKTFKIGLTREMDWLYFGRELQFKPEPAAKCAAVAPHGGRVLIASRDLSNPTAEPGGGVFVL